jgi:hypothetical protein
VVFGSTLQRAQLIMGLKINGLRNGFGISIRMFSPVSISRDRNWALSNTYQISPSEVSSLGRSFVLYNIFHPTFVCFICFGEFDRDHGLFDWPKFLLF